MAGPGGREVGRLSIRVLPDTSNFAVSLQRYLDRIERRARVQVQAVPDLDGFRERLNAKLTRVRARVRVTVDPDLSRFRSTLRERLQGANAGLGVRLEVNEREIARLRRELARIRPPMTIPARVEADRDRLATLARDVSNVGDSSGGAGRKVLSLVGTLGKLSTAASSIPAVAGPSSSIASMGPAAAVAAPAVLALASAGVALKVGMSGLGDALAGDAEAMAELAPAAQDFVTQAKALGPGTVDLLGKKHRGGLQDVVGPPQLGVFPAELLQFFAFDGGQPVVAFASVDLGLANPAAQGFLVAAEVLRDVGDRAARGADLADRALTEFVGIFTGCCHGSEALDLEDGMTVLEIGTGTGYSTALLCHRLGEDNVTSVEVDSDVAQRADNALEAAGYSTWTVTGDGLLGHPRRAPYDRTIATCALRRIPYTWVRQTKPGGIILATVGPSAWSYGTGLAKLTVKDDGTAEGRIIGRSSFMPARAEAAVPLAGDLAARSFYADTERKTPVSPDTLKDWMPAFLAQLAAPGAQFLRATSDGRETVYLFDAGREAFAALTADGDQWTVRQGGPVAIWDAIENTVTAWHDAGEPDITSVRLAVTPEAHAYWIGGQQITNERRSYWLGGENAALRWKHAHPPPLTA